MTPEPLILKAPGEHSAHNYRLVRDCGINMVGNKPVYAAVIEISTSRSSDDNFSDAKEKAIAERFLALWNASVGMTTEQAVNALKNHQAP